MKVVVAHNRYASGQPSGENVIVDTEMAQLAAAGVEVVPFSRSSDEIATLPAAQKALLPMSPIYNGWSQRRLAELIRTERPDVLHLHNPYPLLSPWVVRTAQRAGVPVIQTVHNYRQVCAPGVYYRDGHLCTDCKGRRFPLPAIQHACYRGSRPQSAILATALAVHRRTWLGVDRYIALTDAIAEHLREYGIAAQRITVKANAIPDPGAPSPAPAGGGFLLAGRLAPEKGLGLLLQAWQTHPDGSLGTLRIAGDGPQRDLAVAAAAARSDVEYLGGLDRSATHAAIRAASCVIAPSRWHDVLPTIVGEALASGRPVLGTNLGGIPYLVGDAGWIVEPTVDGLAAALPIAAQETAGAGASAWGAAARSRYQHNFAPDVLTARLLKTYAEVAGGRDE
ncbi:MAG TPA: glycosyltransferase [Micromonosporaceae bacterium]|nr:glycosyltransferase [Micromonosporaceae bacterium]